MMYQQKGNKDIFDATTGQVLKWELVKKARVLEMDYFSTKGVWDKRPIQECYDVTGKGPTSVRWVDVNKQDETNPKYRSRLVAKQFKTSNEPDLFAATPPLEILKMIISIAATRNCSYRGRSATLE